MTETSLSTLKLRRRVSLDNTLRILKRAAISFRDGILSKRSTASKMTDIDAPIADVHDASLKWTNRSALWLADEVIKQEMASLTQAESSYRSLSETQKSLRPSTAEAEAAEQETQRLAETESSYNSLYEIQKRLRRSKEAVIAAVEKEAAESKTEMNMATLDDRYRGLCSSEFQELLGLVRDEGSQRDIQGLLKCGKVAQ